MRRKRSVRKPGEPDEGLEPRQRARDSLWGAVRKPGEPDEGLEPLIGSVSPSQRIVRKPGEPDEGLELGTSYPHLWISVWSESQESPMRDWNPSLAQLREAERAVRKPGE